MTWGWVYFWMNYLFNSESLVLVVTDKCNPGQLSWSNKLQAQFYLHWVQDNHISFLLSSNYVGLYCSPEHLETSQPALHDFLLYNAVVLEYLWHMLLFDPEWTFYLDPTGNNFPLAGRVMLSFLHTMPRTTWPTEEFSTQGLSVCSASFQKVI